MTPRVPNEPRTWREWRERFPEMAGQHAMHEAAHAVAAWFLGDWDLVQISMQPNRKSVARNRRRCFIRPVPIAADAAALKRQWAKYEYAREAIIFLAGPYSDGATEPSDSHWLELAIEISDDFDAMDHWGGILTEQMVLDYLKSLSPLDDITVATLYAYCLFPRSRRRAWRWLDMVAKWTEEMLSLPRMWSAVESLADVLLRQNTMERFRCLDLIGKAMNHKGAPLYLQLPKWRQRFHLPVPKPTAGVQ